MDRDRDAGREMTREAKTLYRELVVEHGQRPRNFGPLADGTHEARAENPLCGDGVTLRLRLVDDRVVAAAFQGRGCMISRASASLLTELVVDRSRAEALEMADRLAVLVDGNAPSPGDAGALEPLRGVRDFPARRACATLAWEALRRALGPGFTPGPVDPAPSGRSL